MFDLPTRLIVAYGIMALLVLAAGALVWWAAYNTRDRRNARDRARCHERYRQRDENRAAAKADH